MAYQSPDGKIKARLFKQINKEVVTLEIPYKYPPYGAVLYEGEIYIMVNPESYHALGELSYNHTDCFIWQTK